MELKLKQITFPEVIEFNFAELKQEVAERTAAYVGVIYGEDQIKDAKKDVAMLRKFTKALSDERIRVKKDLMKPYEEFELKIKELTGIVDKAINEIDEQIKTHEEKQKQDKKKAIQDLWCSLEVIDGRLTLNMIFNQKWLNASVSMKSIQTEMEEQIQKFNDDMASLCNLPEFGFEAQQIYISTLDISKALNEAHRLSEMAKKKAEHEEAMRKIAEEQKAKVAKEEQVEGQVEFTDAKSFDENVLKPAQEGFMNPPIEEAPAKQWVRFQAFMTVEQAKELKQFFDSRNIEFKAV